MNLKHGKFIRTFNYHETKKKRNSQRRRTKHPYIILGKNTTNEVYVRTLRTITQSSSHARFINQIFSPSKNKLSPKQPNLIISLPSTVEPLATTTTHPLRTTMPKPKLNSILGLDDFTDRSSVLKLARAVTAEFLGTLLLVFVGCGTALNLSTPTNLVQISLGFGLVVFAVVHVVGDVSGGHVNPAVTCGLLVSGRIGAARAALYVLAQCVGGIGEFRIDTSILTRNVN